jgi:hypothetical protein
MFIVNKYGLQVPPGKRTFSALSAFCTGDDQLDQLLKFSHQIVSPFCCYNFKAHAIVPEKKKRNVKPKING